MVEKKRGDLKGALLSWFRKNGRRFPWREEGRTPYEVLVAELFLQRTTSKAVASIYPKFLKRYPDFESLRKADVNEVKRIIEPLGLAYRAALLTGIASQVRGSLPIDRKELLEIKGLGDYMASAIRVFSYGKSDPLVDSNILRIAERVWGIRDKDEIKARVRELVEGEPKEAYYALLDLGGMICLPNPHEPKCDACPIKKWCKEYKNRDIGRL